MKPLLSVLLPGLIAATVAGAVTGMPTTAAPEKDSSVYPMDCAKWNDKARCAALNARIELCRSKTDDEWRACMFPSQPTAKFTPPTPRDCSKADNKEVCEAHTVALEACKDRRTRAEHRKCVTGELQATSLTKK